MRYVAARINTQDREDAYRIYVTDALKIRWGFNSRYADKAGFVREETRTSDEIVASIRNKLGGE